MGVERNQAKEDEMQSPTQEDLQREFFEAGAEDRQEGMAHLKLKDVKRAFPDQPNLDFRAIFGAYRNGYHSGAGDTPESFRA